VYDYWLGGKDNFEADRVAAGEVIAVRPTINPGYQGEPEVSQPGGPFPRQ
jgi:hypothetical protein